MKREKRRGGPVLFAGLGGFALGAATVLLVVWVYGMPSRQVGPQGPREPAPPALPPSGPPPGASAGPGAPGSAPGSAPPPAMRQNPASGPDVDALRRHGLLLPVQGVRPQELRDSFAEGRAGHVHEAMDILAPRNTPVLAVEDGRLVKLFVSRQGGNTLYQFDPSETYTYYYAHLERYAPGVREGDLLRRGQVIGYVGTSGNAPPDTPHLHFAIFRLTGEKQWWRGAAIDPFPVLAQP
jgi:murein DD-endopeptidase MepM/ murein hydrolase activator NlpD